MERLQYLYTSENVSSRTHLGGQMGECSDDTLFIPVEHVYKIWQRRKQTSALFLDVSGAFNKCVARAAGTTLQ